MKVQMLHMEGHYEGSNILFSESRALISLQVCISFFTIYSGSKIWLVRSWIYEKSHTEYSR